MQLELERQRVEAEEREAARMRDLELQRMEEAARERDRQQRALQAEQDRLVREQRQQAQHRHNAALAAAAADAQRVRADMSCNACDGGRASVRRQPASGLDTEMHSWHACMHWGSHPRGRRTHSAPPPVRPTPPTRGDWCVIGAGPTCHARQAKDVLLAVVASPAVGLGLTATDVTWLREHWLSGESVRACCVVCV